MKALNLLYNLLNSREFTYVNRGGVKTSFYLRLGVTFAIFAIFCARVCAW